MCDSKCSVYLEEHRARYTAMKGHKVHVVEKPWWDCKFYEWKG
jgi:hypothetical protein